MPDEKVCVIKLNSELSESSLQKHIKDNVQNNRDQETATNKNIYNSAGMWPVANHQFCFCW